MATKFYDKKGKPLTATQFIKSLPKGTRVPARWLEQAKAEATEKASKPKPKDDEQAAEGAQLEEDD